MRLSLDFIVYFVLFGYVYIGRVFFHDKQHTPYYRSIREERPGRRGVDTADRKCDSACLGGNPASSSIEARPQGLPAPVTLQRSQQVAGRIHATTPAGRTPKMQSRLPAVLCTVVAFIHFGREPTSPLARARGRRFGKEVRREHDYAFPHFVFWVKTWLGSNGSS